MHACTHAHSHTQHARAAVTHTSTHTHTHTQTHTHTHANADTRRHVQVRTYGLRTHTHTPAHAHSLALSQIRSVLEARFDLYVRSLFQNPIRLKSPEGEQTRGGGGGVKLGVRKQQELNTQCVCPCTPPGAWHSVL